MDRFCQSKKYFQKSIFDFDALLNWARGRAISSRSGYLQFPDEDGRTVGDPGP